jgi:hypothetical protein
MRAQSAIEFLSTYGFLFAILGVTLSLIAFLGTAASSQVPTQCGSYGGPSCNFVSFYSNSTQGYSVATISITNSESVPINVTNATFTVQNTTSVGACAPQLLYPGQEATCVASIPLSFGIGSTAVGTYAINAGYCNSGISSVSKGACAVPRTANYERVSYGGSFTTGVVQQQEAVFSVAAAVGPANFQGLPYNSFVNNGGPLIPLNYTITQNGDWVANASAGGLVYAFTTSNSQGYPIAGRVPVSFPQSVATTLGANSVSCSNAIRSFNSTLSLASTVLYVRSSSPSAVFLAESDNAMAIFIKQAPASNTLPWTSVFGSNWISGVTAPPASNVLPLNSGLYYLEILWENTCGSGAQEVGLLESPLTTITTLTTSISSTSTSSTSTTILTDSLSMFAGTGGTVTPSSGNYAAGSLITINAIPNTGYAFGNWMGSGSGSYSGTSNPSSVTMNANIVETANFIQTVEVSCYGSGEFQNCATPTGAYYDYASNYEYPTSWTSTGSGAAPGSSSGVISCFSAATDYYVCVTPSGTYYSMSYNDYPTSWTSTGAGAPAGSSGGLSCWSSGTYYYVCVTPSGTYYSMTYTYPTSWTSTGAGAPPGAVSGGALSCYGVNYDENCATPSGAYYDYINGGSNSNMYPISWISTGAGAPPGAASGEMSCFPAATDYYVCVTPSGTYYGMSYNGYPQSWTSTGAGAPPGASGGLSCWPSATNYYTCVTSSGTYYSLTYTYPTSWTSTGAGAPPGA